MPAGSIAGVEFATPGVTSPGLEKYLPGADAYIRALYPAVDGLDGLFDSYVDGLAYADVNRRGFLDLTITLDKAIGSFQFLDGLDPMSGLPLWAQETVVAGSDFSLSLLPEAPSQISWQPGWLELDLVFGLALGSNGSQSLLDPAAFATVPRAGVQLADVSVLGSESGDRVFVGIGSLVNGAAGDDTLFNTDSQGGNGLVGGSGGDHLFLQPVHDLVMGGQLFGAAADFGLAPFTALVDRERDSFLIDGGAPGTAGLLQIVDFELGVDDLLVDGVIPEGDWLTVRQQLQGLNVAINAAPQLSTTASSISIRPGEVQALDLSPDANDPDGDSLQLLKLKGPGWITTSGTTLSLAAPADLSADQLASTELVLAFSDGRALADFRPTLTLEEAPPSPPVLTIAAGDAARPEGNSGSTPFSFTVNRSGDTSGSSTVAWSVAGSGTAAEASDFSGGMLPSGSITFTPGQTSQTINIEVAGDLEPEADEGFTVTLSTPSGASLEPSASSAAGLIRNDDTPPPQLPALRITASDADRSEGSFGTTAFTFAIARAGDATGISSATWRVGLGENPSANGADFAGTGLPSGIVRFKAGESVQTITVKVQGDLDGEAHERFSVTLSDPTGATLARAASAGIIRNDDRIGTAAADRLKGTDTPEFMAGLAGQDSLTGGIGPDLFGFRYGHSPIPSPDRITDFRFGDDRILIFSGNNDSPATPARFSRATNNRTAATHDDLAAAVFADADGLRNGNQPLAANAAALVVATNPAIAGTYLLINDRQANRSLSSDLMITITGAGGPLPAIGANPVSSIFA